jgi:hypothetical protein
MNPYSEFLRCQQETKDTKADYFAASDEDQQVAKDEKLAREIEEKEKADVSPASSKPPSPYVCFLIVCIHLPPL